LRGAEGLHSRSRDAKGVTLARAVVMIAREGAPGSVVHAIPPQGPHALQIECAWGDGFPPP
jgi:hypothetical protein